MCLIVVHKPGAAAMDVDELVRAWQLNSDGAGYTYVHKRKVYVRKPFFKLKDLKKCYYEDHARFGAEAPFVLHLRLATHGKRDKQDTHPFLLETSAVGVAHNGVLWSPHRGYSDSRFFCETVLALRSQQQLMSNHFKLFLEGMVGSFNKIAMLSSRGQVSIVNEDMGTWRDGRWYSSSISRYVLDPLASVGGWDTLSVDSGTYRRVYTPVGPHRDLELETDPEWLRQEREMRRIMDAEDEEIVKRIATIKGQS